MSDLAIPSLTIENFRCLFELHIEQLGRVNLITGRNSVGKSYLLEAIELFAKRGGLDVAVRQMQARGDIRPGPRRILSRLGDQTTGVAALFHGWEPIVDGQRLRVSTPTDVAEVGVAWELRPARSSADDELPAEEDDDVPAPYLKAWWNGEAMERISLLSMPDSFVLGRRRRVMAAHASTPCLRWALDEPDNADLAALWSNVGLLAPGQAVLDAMQLVYGGIEGLQFRAREGGQYLPEVKLAGVERLMPLQSLGDGLRRVLAVVLGLVSVSGGLLLLDEVETGLHYSVQYDLWRTVFRLARDLNVQVFATTHSWDCIEGFQQAAAEDAAAEANLVRLQADNGRYHVSTFDRDDLAVVARHDIEVR